MMKRIWLIRHGESIANAGEPTEDHKNIPLSMNGMEQARHLADQIETAPDLIVTSPYLRAQQTALPTMAKFPQAERGIWDCIHEFVYLAPATCVGTTFAQRRPRVIAYWRRLDPDYVDGEGAESYARLIGRIDETLSLLQSRKERFIILFTHAQFIRNFLLAYRYPGLTAKEYMAMFRRSEGIKNCQITEITM